MPDTDPDVADLGSFGFEDADAWLHQFRAAQAPAQLGSLGPYALLAELGRGGQGVVYRALQPGTGREIALKRLAPGTLASARARRRFEREIEAAATLNHPNIAAAYAADAVDGVPLLAMELVEGEAFTRWAGGRPRAEVLSAFIDVCEGVHHAHCRGVIHRDLKPSNILVVPGPPAHPKVLDFGLARLGDDPEASIPGQFLGTPAYASPEQMQGRGTDVDARSDAYALGLVLHEALTGRLPGSAPVPGEASLPRQLKAVVARATAEERDQRYPAVSALTEDLRRFLAGQPVLAQPPSAADVLCSLARRNPAAAVAIVLLLVTLVLSAAGLAAMAVRLSAQRRAALEARDRERVSLRTAVRVNDYMSNVLLFADPNRAGSDSVPVREALDRAASAADAALSAEPRAAAIVHQKLGRVYAGLWRFDAAVAEFGKSLVYFRANPGEQGADLAEALRYLGAASTSAGRIENAVDRCEEAVNIARGLTTGDGSCLVSALNDLADARLAQGGAIAAEALYRESLDRVARLGQSRSGKAANAYRGLGSALMSQHRPTEAADAFTLALAINTELLGEANPVAATYLANLGQALRQCGDPGGAERALSRALELLRGAYRAGNPVIGQAERALRSIRDSNVQRPGGPRSPRPRDLQK